MAIIVEKKERVKHKFLGLPPGIWKVVKTFCDDSNLHGLKYVSNPGVRYIERYLWFGLFLMNLVIVIYFTYDLFVNWMAKPVLLKFSPHTILIHEIPFPAVTVCNYFAIKRSFLDLVTTQNKTLLNYASFVCAQKDELLKKAKREESIGNDFYGFIEKAAPNCSETFESCRFAGREMNCCNMFFPTVTSRGLCFVFNNLPPEKIYKNSTFVPYPSLKHPPNTMFWNPDRGYPPKELRITNSSYTFPLWQQAVEERLGLVLVLKQNISEWQEICSGAHSGFRIYLENPTDSVYFSPSYRVLIDRYVSIALSAFYVESGRQIIPMPPRRRLCYFDGEKELRLFSQYSKKNCDLECDSDWYIAECGCVPFFYPHDEKTRICKRIQDHNCYRRAKHKKTKLAMEMPLDQRTYYHPCECYRGCHELKYSVTASGLDFLTEKMFHSNDFGANLIERKSKLTIQLKQHQYLKKRRILNYSALSFTARVGGLLSLFLGFSFISLLEVFYFFILRPLARSEMTFLGKKKDAVRLGTSSASSGNIIRVAPVTIE